MRDFNWMDILFGLALAVVVVLVWAAVGSVIVFMILGYSSSEGSEMLFSTSGVALMVGMLILARLYPGPGHIVERPLLAVAAFVALPALVSILLLLEVVSPDAPWYIPVLFYGVYPSALVGFVMFVAIDSEARKTSGLRTSWPIARPASVQGGLLALPRREAKVYAGLERGGTEESRPDTFARMKSEE